MSLMRRIPFPQNLTRTVDRRPTRVAYALPTFFTAANMFFGFVSVMKAFEGAMLMAQGLPGANIPFVLAAQMIGLAVLMDGLDGRIARMTNTTSDFGREMDSMADAITFGVAPAVLGFAWGFQGVDTSGNAIVRDHLLRLGYFVCFLYLLSGCARLARFNITTNPVPKNPGRPDRKYFVGLPIPAAAGLAAAVVYAAEGMPLKWWPAAVIWLLLLGLLAFLMVCTWRYRSFKDLNLMRPRSPLLIIFLGSLIYLVWNYSHAMLLVLGVMYVGSGIAVRLGGLLKRMMGPPAGARA
ncbi:MAG TPA: phosphatidylcholine/phosphatidylserine synthase [Bryobacteraceae bacterium]|nr:phosphatidylcholine/phosphatidylserine synthase [Bryobacteraceae bacterium]